jgi:hypothetical protein
MQPKENGMKTRWLAAVKTLGGVCSSIFSTNGKVVTVVAVMACCAAFEPVAAANGKAVTLVGGMPKLFTIVSNAVTSSEMLPMPAGTNKVSSPHFFLDGTRIAFFRSSGASAWLSTYNLQTRQTTDLLKVTNWPGSARSPHISCPIGDWVYYVLPCPDCNGNGKWDIFSEIWRVNVKDTSLNEFVYNYNPYSNAYFALFEKWNCSADGRWATSTNGADGGNFMNDIVSCFPPQEPINWDDPFFFSRHLQTSDCPAKTGVRACNNALSAGANFFTHYVGGHDALFIEYWDKVKGTHVEFVNRKYATCPEWSMCNNEVCRWAGVDPNLYSVGDWPVWSCNSDRWLNLFVVKKSGGGDCFVINWINRQAMRLTNNSGGESPAGDFFVEGGPPNAWEDTLGVWHSLVASPDSTQISAPIITPDGSCPGVNARERCKGAYIFSPTQISMSCPTAGAEIRYTLDGSNPTQSSTLYGAPLTISTTITVKARAFKSGSNPSYARTALFQAARAPDNPPNTEAGLKYSYYEGTDWNYMPKFDSYTPVRTGVCANFDKTLATKTTYFGFKFEGFIQVPTDGIFQFSMVSEDGGKIFIGNEMVEDGGAQFYGTTTVMGSPIGLKAGKHAIRVYWYNGNGTSTALTVNMNGQAIPAASLFRSMGTSSSRPAIRKFAGGPELTANRAGIAVHAPHAMLVRIFDTKGNLVISRSIAGKQTVTLPRINPGCYSAIVTQGVDVVSKRLVIQ